MAEKDGHTQRILKLGVDEIFEDLTYSVAYNEILKRLKDNGMDEGILKDAINSGVSIMFSAALMVYIQKQEQILHAIIGVVSSVLLGLFGILRNQAKGLFKKFFKGRKASMFSNIFGMSNDDKFNYAKVLVSGGDMVINAKASNSSVYHEAQTFTQQRQLLVSTKDQQLAYAKAKVDSINQTLLFKLFTSKFTSQDKEILRKITGSSEIDIDQINQVASFMFVKDSNGNITGLSEQFMTMLNGLGYFQKKGK